MASFNPDEKQIKRPQDDTLLSDEEAEEWIKCAQCFYYFASNYVYVQGEGSRSLFVPRDYQRRVIENAMNNTRTITTMGRQSGKTISFTAYILWKMTFNQDFQVGISSYQNVNVADFCTRIAFAYENLPWFLKEPCIKYTQSAITFSNGSSMYGQVSSVRFGRGKSLSMVVLDELGFVDANVSSDMISSLLGSLSANGPDSEAELHIISTPNGTQGAFYDIWSAAITGDSEFSPVKVDYEEIPGRGPDENGYDAFEAKMLRSGETQDKFDQEYRCHFISSSGTLVNSRFLESIKATEPVKEVGDLRIFVDSLRGRKLAIACDPAEGIQEDASVFQVFDVMTFEQVAEYQNNSVNQSQLIVHLLNIVKYFDSSGAEEIFFSYESNGIGAGIGILIDRIMEDPVFERVQIINDPNNEKKGKMGMTTTNKSKLEACGIFKDLVENGKITLRSQRLLNELKTFVKTGASFAAQPGNHDDLVSGCLLYVRMLDHLKNFEEQVYDTVSEVTLDNESDEVFDIFF